MRTMLTSEPETPPPLSTSLHPQRALASCFRQGEHVPLGSRPKSPDLTLGSVHFWLWKTDWLPGVKKWVGAGVK